MTTIRALRPCFIRLSALLHTIVWVVFGLRLFLLLLIRRPAIRPSGDKFAQIHICSVLAYRHLGAAIQPPVLFALCACTPFTVRSASIAPCRYLSIDVHVGNDDLFSTMIIDLHDGSLP